MYSLGHLSDLHVTGLSISKEFLSANLGDLDKLSFVLEVGTLLSAYELSTSNQSSGEIE